MYGFVEVMNYPQFLHTTLALFNRKFKRLPGRLDYIKKTLAPVLERYQQSGKRHTDGVQWAWDHAANQEQQDTEYQALVHIIMYYFNLIFIMPTVGCPPFFWAAKLTLLARLSLCFMISPPTQNVSSLYGMKFVEFSAKRLLRISLPTNLTSF
jgi:hypothetical protein